MADSLENLRLKLASLYNEGIESSELGNLALEIILERNKARNELEHNPTPNKKVEIENKIEELREFERAVVSLYMLQGVKTSGGKAFKLSDFTKPRYNLFTKKKIPS